MVGSASPLADAEIVGAVHAGLEALGISDFQFPVNSRQALRGLLEAYNVDPELGDKVLGSLDKLDKMAPDASRSIRESHPCIRPQLLTSL